MTDHEGFLLLKEKAIEVDKKILLIIRFILKI